jgi:hypothetical protein
MGKNGNGNGSSSRFNYPRTSSELDSANSKAHCPHGPKIPSQTEAGADALKAGHRKVSDIGMLTRAGKVPGAQSSPLDGSVDLPYDSFAPIR